MGQWTRTCALCHIRGEGGAPVLGDREAWSPRLAQGEEVLLEHTVEGLNNMPPLGYCMDCEEEDFRQIIRFMAGGEA
jgi:cytochrome c5